MLNLHASECDLRWDNLEPAIATCLRRFRFAADYDCERVALLTMQFIDRRIRSAQKTIIREMLTESVVVKGKLFDELQPRRCIVNGFLLKSELQNCRLVQALVCALLKNE